MNGTAGNVPPNAIAIVGMAARVPGASDVEGFWSNVVQGVESISRFSDEELLASGVPREVIGRANYVNARGVLDQADCFDASFFGYSVDEARVLDPQQRVLLECAWHALEHAGYDTEAYDCRVGLYAGANVNTYWLQHPAGDRLADPLRWYQLRLANDKDFLATRVSYKLNLTGPSVAVQTACSTSLVAVTLACQSLLDHQCDLALAGGVSVGFPQKSGYLFHDGGIASPDGHCRAYSAQARGCVSGDGVALVVLRRLEDAIVARDTIHGVIRGAAINNDGSSKVGFTAPSIAGQTSVIEEALAVADVGPSTIGYVEGHGTGTTIGDPIEVSALTEAFRGAADQKQYCGLGSVKTNIGHLDAAAGVAGLIKAVLAAKHGIIPPSLHFDAANPKLNLATSPFYVPVTATPWPSERRPRRAGVSSFGVGGTNAHVVIEEPPSPMASGPSRRVQLLTLSAKSRAALDATVTRLNEFLRHDAAAPIADVAYTLHVGRRALPYRRAVVCRDNGTAIAALAQETLRSSSDQPVDAPLPVFFMFPGQGSQLRRMGAELYCTESTYRHHLDECANVLASSCDFDLRSWLEDGGATAGDADAWGETARVQPGLFAIEYALARMWQEWGLKPAGMIGHSIGEYVAACLAGVFELEDALRLVFARGALMQQMEPGAMLAAEISEQDAGALVSESLSVAAVNAPDSCTLSGPVAAIETVATHLRANNIRCTRLHTSHAFHSWMMNPVMEPFARVVGETNLGRPQVPFISNISGTWITDEEATSPDYWVRHLRDTVRCADGLGELLNRPAGAYLEVGPGRTMSSLVRRQPAAIHRHLVLGSLAGGAGSSEELQVVHETLASCWANGVPIDWAAFHGDEHRNRIALPGYPFERRQYILPPSPAAGADTDASAGRAALADSPSQWLYAPIWRQTAHVGARNEDSAPTVGNRWLMLADEGEIGRGVAARLRGRGDRVVVVKGGERFARLDTETYAVDVSNEASFDALLEALGGEHERPDRVVHCWSLGPPAEPDDDTLEMAHRRGIGSLVLLTKAMVRAGWRQAIRLSAVTSEMQPVLGPARHPEQAPLLGFCRVAVREHPNVACAAIDISLDEPAAQTIELLTTELVAAASDECVAYRDGRRWGLSYQPVTWSESYSEPPMRRGGTYLITGGLGGVGLSLAEHLQQTCDANLVLVTRSGRVEGTHDQERKRETLSRLLSGRGQVLILQADVTSRADLENAIERAEARFGTIHGVIHAAGVPGGGLIRTKTFDEMVRVLEPKVTGTLQLAKCFRGKPLDFFVMCSSISAVLGEVGQVDYCAANAFLDAFGHSSAVPRGATTLAINWDRWREVGMAANAPAVSGTSAETSLPSTADDAPAHPLIDGRRRSGDEEVCTTYFSPRRHWVLDQHRVGGSAVLPGTAYIELAAAAFGGGRVPNGPLEFRDVYFLRPIHAASEDTIEIRTLLRPTGKGATFRIVSVNAANGTMTEHGGGTISRCDGVPSENRNLPLESATDRELCMSEMLPVDDGWIVRGNKRLGPRWNVLRRISSTETPSGIDLRAVLDSSPVAGGAREYYADPALLDVAISYPLATMVDARDDNYLALGCQRLVLERPLPTRVVSHVRWSADPIDKGTRHWDVVLADEDGVVIGLIERFTVRAERNDSRPSSAALGDRAVSEPVEQPVGMTPAEGVEVFRLALSLGLPQTIVSIQSLTARLRDPGMGRADTPGHRWHHAAASNAVAKTAERTDVIAAVHGIWREILGAPVEGPDDDFFQLGGDSLLAVRMTAKLRDQLGVSLGVDAIFDQPTVGELCGLVVERHRRQGIGESQSGVAAPTV